jgi:hypothetical protein
MHLYKDRKWSWIGKGMKKETVREVDWKVCIQNLGGIQSNYRANDYRMYGAFSQPVSLGQTGCYICLY